MAKNNEKVTKLFSKFPAIFLYWQPSKVSQNTSRSNQNLPKIWKPPQQRLVESDEMDKKWRRKNGSSHRSESQTFQQKLWMFGGRTTVILNNWTKLDCRNGQSHRLSWNWARTPSQINSENSPIFCLKICRPAWDILSLHDRDAISTRKYLGSNGTSIGQIIVSGTLKFSQWLKHWIGRN